MDAQTQICCEEILYAYAAEEISADECEQQLNRVGYRARLDDPYIVRLMPIDGGPTETLCC